MAPCQGHLHTVKQIFDYLKHYSSGKILVDPKFHDWSKYNASQEYTWQESYPHAQEEISQDLLQPLGKPTRIMHYVDTDHAHDQATQRLVTGILLFVNGMPTKWVSKHQNTVESSTYGSEMVAARIACKLILKIQYKLHMLGIPVDMPVLLLGDNLSMLMNTTVPSSVLKKKHQAINYHCIHKCVAA